MAHNQRKHCGPIQATKRKAKYAGQKLTTELNRRKKRERHARNHPRDLPAQKLLT